MLINILNILTEASLYLLLFAVTFSNSATEIFAISIIVFFAIKKVVLKSYKMPKTPINLCLYALCLVIFVTFLRSAYFSESIRGFIRIIKFAFLFFALFEFFSDDKKRLIRTFWVIMGIACFTFLNGIFQSIHGFDLVRHYDLTKDDYLRRIQASFGHPNDFAAYIIFILPLTFCLFCKELKRNQRVFLVMNCLLGAYCLLKTSSRAAWLGFLIGLIIYFLYYKKKILIFIPLVLALLALLIPHGVDRIADLFKAEHNTVWERVQLWKGTLAMVKVHPFLGFGANTFSRYFPLFKPPDYPDFRYTHNSYLQMWSEIGIIGLTAFLSVIFAVLKNVFCFLRNKVNSGLSGFVLLGIVAGYAAFLIQSGLDTNLFSLRLTTLFWVMTAYVLSINKALEEGIASSPAAFGGDAPRNDGGAL